MSARKRSQRRRTPHVALLVESSRAYGRGLLRGVAAYVQQHGPWSIYFQPQGLEQVPPSWLAKWQGDGILARIDNRRMAEAVQRANVPVIDVRGALADIKVPLVGVDNAAIIELAVSHFIERGYRRFGFCAYPRRINRFLDLRCELFRQRIVASGYECSIFPANQATFTHWEHEQTRMVEWLSSLVKPVAVMTPSDERGLQVLDACQRANLPVPSAVSVLSIDNDECICRLTRPPLSSIDVNTELVGYKAAQLLDRMMKNKSYRPATFEVPPRGVACRQSTDELAIDDAEVARAVRFIREHASTGLDVEAVVREIGTSRRTFERRFRDWMGRSPKSEILRVQLARACDLLSNSDLSVANIAERSGFRSLSYFADSFHRRIGMPPGAYRKKFRYPGPRPAIPDERPRP